MDQELLRVAAIGTARLVRLHRPARHNALNLQMLGELRSALEDADGDADVRGVVLAGSEKVFSTGADLTEAVDVRDVAGVLRYLRELGRVATTMESLSKPVVAAIDGYCFTGGLELALACDLRFAGPTARFAITSSSIGSLPGMGATQRLPRVIGETNAKDLLLSARVIDLDEATTMGLVRAAPGGAVEDALRWLELTADRAPLSVWLAKWAVGTGSALDLGPGLELERVAAALLFTSEDKNEGMHAFLEKRPPRFEGR